MVTVSQALFTALVMFIIGCFISWVHTHHTIATECQRLGAFYVGDKVFECHLKPKGAQ